MGLFKSSPFPSKGAYEPSGGSNSQVSNIAVWYRRTLKRHPALLFGLPFIGTIVAGSFFLTPATAIRYERFDRKTHALDRSEAMGLGFKNLGQKKAGTDSPSAPSVARDPNEEKKKSTGKFKSRDIREEYYKLAGNSQKLDDWEPVRVQRLPGEPDGTFDD